MVLTNSADGCIVANILNRSAGTYHGVERIIWIELNKVLISLVFLSAGEQPMLEVLVDIVRFASIADDSRSYTYSIVLFCHGN